MTSFAGFGWYSPCKNIQKMEIDLRHILGARCIRSKGSFGCQTFEVSSMNKFWVSSRSSRVVSVVLNYCWWKNSSPLRNPWNFPWYRPKNAGRWDGMYLGIAFSVFQGQASAQQAKSPSEIRRQVRRWFQRQFCIHNMHSTTSLLQYLVHGTKSCASWFVVSKWITVFLRVFVYGKWFFSWILYIN